MKNNIYSFDDCTILNLCKITVPKAYFIFVGQNKITHKDHEKIDSLITILKKHGIPRYKFIPTTMKDKILYVAGQRIENTGLDLQRIKGFKRNFKAFIIDELEKFSSEIDEQFDVIEKDNDIDYLKELFKENERELKKGREKKEKNISEDDDLSILKGLMNKEVEGKKYLISHDEHFWGYKDLIKGNSSIIVIEEWNCNNLIKKG